MSPERRRRTRVSLCVPAEVVLDHATVAVDTLNISLKGVLLTSAPFLEVGLACRVRLHLGPEASLHLKGRIIRVGEGQAAIDFTGMDEETFAHLRRLVECNSPDPEGVLPELLAPAFPLFLAPRPRPVLAAPPAASWRTPSGRGEPPPEDS
ncbi:MAG: PilZ domain-containing protein [Deltaproteobacteria bacterium]|nr:PilZ domain-containing protein [Deltaproteobacteria bacterium]